MKLNFSVLREAGAGVLASLLVDIQNAFRKFRKKKITTFEEPEYEATELYHLPKPIDNGHKQNSKLRVASRRNIHDSVDKKL